MKTTSAAVSGVLTYAQIVYLPAEWVEGRFIHPRTGKVVQQWYRASDLPEHVQEFQELNAKGYGVYLGVNPRPSYGAKKDKSIKIARVVFCDFDKTTVEEALLRIHSLGLPRPNLVIISGHGVHAYWLLLDPTEDLIGEGVSK